MGASNALLVYRTWGAVLGDRPMRALTYMAIVARDSDAEPWFGLGHEALAEIALGVKPDEAGLRAVRRAVTELRKAGAITTAKRPSNQGRHVHYRLWLSGPSPVAERPVNNAPDCGQPPVDNPLSPDAQRPTTRPVTGRLPSYNGAVVGRLVVTDRTLSDLPHREEEEEEVKAGAKNPEANLRTASCGKHARAPPQGLPA